MTQCRCEACAPDSPGPTYTRAWAFDLEARMALQMSLERRRDYLAMVEKRRGAAGRTALENEIRKQWERQRESVITPG